jgi:hypothetical protein
MATPATEDDLPRDLSERLIGDLWLIVRLSIAAVKRPQRCVRDKSPRERRIGFSGSAHGLLSNAPALPQRMRRDERCRNLPNIAPCGRTVTRRSDQARSIVSQETSFEGLPSQRQACSHWSLRRASGFSTSPSVGATRTRQRFCRGFLPGTRKETERPSILRSAHGCRGCGSQRFRLSLSLLHPAVRRSFTARRRPATCWGTCCRVRSRPRPGTRGWAPIAPARLGLNPRSPTT